MNFFDLLFSFLFIFFGILSIFRGPIKALIITICFGGGLMAAEMFHEQYSSLLSPYLGGAVDSKAVTYCLIFIVGVVLGKILSAVSSLLFPISTPSVGLKIFAAILGGVQGLCFSLFLYSLVTRYIPSFTDDLNNSLFVPWFEKIAGLIQ